MLNNEKYNILFITTGLGIGGLETYLLNILRFIDKNKFNPIIVYNILEQDDYLPEIKSLGVNVFAMTTGFSQLRFLPKIYNFIRKRKINIICDFRNDFSGPSLLIAKMLGVPSRIAMYRSSQRAFNSTFLRNTYASLLHTITKVSATHIVGNTQKVLDNYYHTWRKHDKFMIIHNGIDLSYFDRIFDRHIIRHSLGISTDKIIIGHLGRLHPSKNHNAILASFSILINKIVNAHLLLIGEGPLRKNIEADIKRLGLHDHVTLAGLRRDIPEMLSVMDLFFYPSIYEGLPNALLEAMASGLSYVASNIAEIDEISPPHQKKFLCNPKDIDTMAKFLFDLCVEEKSRKSLGQINKEYVASNYSMNKSMTTLIDLFLRPIIRNAAIG